MWKNLVFAMLRVSILGFGGGPSSIPILQKEVVENYKWLNDEQFNNILAVGNALPGPILTKMAGYIGYHLKGVLGATIAILVTTVPTIVGLVLIFALLGSIDNMPRVEGATSAIQPVVGVMLAVMAYQIFSKNIKKLGLIVSVMMIAACLLFMSWLSLHPAIIIAVLLIVGVSIAKPITLKRKKEDN